MAGGKTFAQSREANFQRRIRALVRGSKLTRSEKEVALAFLNHWFVHRHKGPVHPGRKKLAKRSKASLPTVKRTLAMLRHWRAITAVARLEGLDGKATEYTVDVDCLEALCKTHGEVLKAWRKEHNGVNGGSNEPTLGGVKMNRRNNHALKVIYGSKGISND
jgi:hypothetical protein